MSMVYVYAVTDVALTHLGVSWDEDSMRFDSSVMNWTRDVEWSANGLSQRYILQRVTRIKSGDTETLKRWQDAAEAAGFEVGLLTDLSDWVPRDQSLATKLALFDVSIEETEEAAELRRWLTEPSNDVIASWAFVRRGGGDDLFTDYELPSWLPETYGDGLGQWLSQKANCEAIYSRYPGLLPWDLSVTKHFKVDTFDFENMATFTDGRRWIPLRRLPCTGLIITLQGEVVPSGLLPVERDHGRWFFDPSGTIEKYAIEKQASLLSRVTRRAVDTTRVLFRLLTDLTDFLPSNQQGRVTALASNRRPRAVQTVSTMNPTTLRWQQSDAAIFELSTDYSVASPRCVLSVSGSMDGKRFSTLKFLEDTYDLTPLDECSLLLVESLNVVLFRTKCKRFFDAYNKEKESSTPSQEILLWVD